MDFTYTEDQLLFRDAARKYLVVTATPELSRSMWDTKTGRSSKSFAAFAEQGFTGLMISEAEGGLACTELDWALIAQEVGYHGVPESLLATACMGVGLLNSLPQSHPLRSAWLPRILQGQARVAVHHPIDPLVADAHVAHLLLLVHGDEVHAVERAAVEVEFSASVDPSRRLHRVIWTASAATRIAQGKLALDLADDLLNRGALVTAAQLLGLASRMMDLGVDYSSERKQFGKPIGSFQAVKHLMADVAVAIEFAKPVLNRAAYAVAHRLADRAVHVSHAKLACGEAAALAARHAMQVHGAMGYTWEMDLQIFMKRAWALDASWGTRGFHKQRVAQAVLGGGQALGPSTTFDSANI